MNSFRVLMWIGLMACVAVVFYHKHIVFPATDGNIEVISAIVLKPGCNLRTGPGTKFRVIRKITAEEDAVFPVTDLSGKWKYAQDGADKFWVHSVCVTYESS